MPAIPPSTFLETRTFGRAVEMFYISGTIATFSLSGTSLAINHAVGQVLVGMRENELRIELLGFDVRLLKLVAFALAAAIAGLAGILFTNWNAFIDPHVLQLGF